MLTRHNPFLATHAGAISPFREFDTLLRELGGAGWSEGRSLAPAADILETAEGVTLEVDLPGHDPKGIQVQVENDVLTLRSERRAAPLPEGEKSSARRERMFGSYERTFVLPKSVDASRVEARFENGVLSLHLPRREETKPRVIEVKVQQG